MFIIVFYDTANKPDGLDCQIHGRPEAELRIQ